MRDYEEGELRRIDWNECFPFTRIFRSFRVSIGLTKLILVFSGVFSTYIVGRALDWMWPEKSRSLVVSSAMGGQSELDVFLIGGAREAENWLKQGAEDEDAQRIGCFDLMFTHARRTANAITGGAVRADGGRIVDGIAQGFQGLIWLFSMHPVFGILLFLLMIAIWSLFGGAACRAAALELARDDLVNVREALEFSKTRFVNYVSAPLIPPIAALCIAFFLFLLGLVGLIWGAGEILFGIFAFPVSLLGGMALAAVVLLSAVSWPLMWPAISADNHDAMAGCGTAWQFFWNRPWKTAFYAFVAIVFGGICIFLLKLFVTVMLWGAGACAGVSMNWGDAYGVDAEGKDVRVDSTLEAMWQPPDLTSDRPYYGTFDKGELRGVSAFGQWCLKAWIYLLTGLVAAIVVSYFFTASTSIYLLLRRDVDGTDWEDVYLEPVESDEPAGQAPQAVEPKTEPPSAEKSEGAS